MSRSTPIMLAALAAPALVATVLACSSTSENVTPPAEAGADVVAPPAEPPPPEEEDGSAVRCSPHPIMGFTPRFHAGAGTYQNKCTTTEMDAVFTACFGAVGTDGTCATAKLASPTCHACLLGTLDSDPSPPIIQYPGFRDRNIAACVGLFTGDTGPTSCAAKTAAAFQCGLAACPPSVCPINAQKDFVPLNACTTAANESPAHCKAQADAANACLASAGADVKRVCLESIANGAIYDVLRHYSELFCGSSPDAGDGG